MRRLLLAVALTVGLPLTFLSLIDLPYRRPIDWGTGITTVNAVGRQWNWTLSETSFHVGDRVEFRVTSEDVNHGFALYDPAMRVVAQTQAMPGYVNVLRHSFEAPGTYTVLCLEYCGVAHHSMAAEITVLPRQ
ncbi:MAG: cytochrome C oxidase subunit II [Bacteroidota bacterium]